MIQKRKKKKNQAKLHAYRLKKHTQHNTHTRKKKKNKLDFYLARCHICLTHDGAFLIWEIIAAHLPLLSACCFSLFLFFLFPCWLAAKKIERKKRIDTDRNLSYYIAKCPKHETEKRTCLCVCSFIYSFVRSSSVFFPDSALRFVTATAGQNQILPPQSAFFSPFFFFFCSSLIFCLIFLVCVNI